MVRIPSPSVDQYEVRQERMEQHKDEDSHTAVSRRKFLKKLSQGAAVVATGGVAGAAMHGAATPSSTAAEEQSKVQYGMLIDARRCFGVHGLLKLHVAQLVLQFFLDFWLRRLGQSRLEGFGRFGQQSFDGYGICIRSKFAIKGRLAAEISKVEVLFAF